MLRHSEIELKSVHMYDDIKEEKENILNEDCCDNNPIQSVRKRPDHLVLKKEVLIEHKERPKSTLTPREEFFQDLIMAANRYSYIEAFIEEEKKNQFPLENPASPTEYFIANVSDKVSHVTSVNMFVTQDAIVTNPFEIKLQRD